MLIYEFPCLSHLLVGHQAMKLRMVCLQPETGEWNREGWPMAETDLYNTQLCSLTMP